MKTTRLALVVLVMGFVACQSGQNQQPVDETKNQVVEAIMSRRSIRAYKPEQVKDEELKTIIECAINAPSAGNRQSWAVRVIQNPELLKEIGDESIRLSERNLFFNAPTLIVVAADETDVQSHENCGLLTQNILLAAESMSIGTCVIGLLVPSLNAETILPQLNIPDTHKIIYAISLGYKDEAPDARPRDASKVQIIK